MLKQLSQQLTAKTVIAESENEMPVFEIILNGQTTGKMVFGAVLEAVVS